MFCFVGRVRELEGLSGEFQPFAQTPMAMSRAALTWGEESKPLGSGESRWFSSRAGSGSCIQKAKVACEATPKCDQMYHGFARSLPGLRRSHNPGKGPVFQGLTAWAPPCCFLQTKKTGAVDIPCDGSLNSCLYQSVSCPRGLGRISVFLLPQGP